MTLTINSIQASGRGMMYDLTMQRDCSNSLSATFPRLFSRGSVWRVSASCRVCIVHSTVSLWQTLYKWYLKADQLAFLAIPYVKNPTSRVNYSTNIAEFRWLLQVLLTRNSDWHVWTSFVCSCLMLTATHYRLVIHMPKNMYAIDSVGYDVDNLIDCCADYHLIGYTICMWWSDWL